jgi:hypothetical protein
MEPEPLSCSYVREAMRHGTDEKAAEGSLYVALRCPDDIAEQGS